MPGQARQVRQAQGAWGQCSCFQASGPTYPSLWRVAHKVPTHFLFTLSDPLPPSPWPHLAADNVGTHVHKVGHIVERQVVLQESPEVWDGLIGNDPAGSGEEQRGGSETWWMQARVYSKEALKCGTGS